MGSYVTAWTMKTWHLDAFFAIGLGGSDRPQSTGACALGYLAIKRSGIYFAMITLGIGTIGLFRVPGSPPSPAARDGIQQVPARPFVRLHRPVQ